MRIEGFGFRVGVEGLELRVEGLGFKIAWAESLSWTAPSCVTSNCCTCFGGEVIRYKGFG